MRSYVKCQLREKFSRHPLKTFFFMFSPVFIYLILWLIGRLTHYDPQEWEYKYLGDIDISSDGINDVYAHKKLYLSLFFFLIPIGLTCSACLDLINEKRSYRKQYQYTYRMGLINFNWYWTIIYAILAFPSALIITVIMGLTNVFPGVPMVFLFPVLYFFFLQNITMGFLFSSFTTIYWFGILMCIGSILILMGIYVKSFYDRINNDSKIVLSIIIHGDIIEKFVDIGTQGEYLTFSNIHKSPHSLLILYFLLILANILGSLLFTVVSDAIEISNHVIRRKQDRKMKLFYEEAYLMKIKPASLEVIQTGKEKSESSVKMFFHRLGISALTGRWKEEEEEEEEDNLDQYGLEDEDIFFHKMKVNDDNDDDRQNLLNIRNQEVHESETDETEISGIENGKGKGKKTNTEIPNENEITNRQTSEQEQESFKNTKFSFKNLNKISIFKKNENTKSPFKNLNKINIFKKKKGIDYSVPNVEIENLFKTYTDRRHQVVVNVSLKAFPCEICAVYGERGAGKSTFLKMVYGQIRSSYGSIILLKKKMNSNNWSYLTKRIAVAPRENFMFFEQSSVKDNLDFYKSMYRSLIPRLPSKKTKTSVVHSSPTSPTSTGATSSTSVVVDIVSPSDQFKVEQMIQDFNFQGQLKDSLNTLDQGERNKLKTILALLKWKHCRIMVLEEPTEGMSESDRTTYWKALHARRQPQWTVFFSTTSAEEAYRNANNVLYLEEGKVKYMGNVKTFKSTYPDLFKNEKSQE